ncbi:MAG: phenylalanine--tRNA ligase subunit beta [Syntrophales bacterium]|nr:phenylalanine--tRNA ligase subunit beta [Syntrophales bacterium]
MKVSLRWLKDYVDVDMDAAALAESLTMAGLEVDAVEEKRPDFSGVVVAKILSVRSHPTADKLHLCEVTTGQDVLPIVCGAPNTRMGDTVALARVGAVIPGGYVIKSSLIRGERSEGMLCSAEELGIGDDNTGILVLPSHLPLGMDLAKALDLKDTVLDIGVTPNRADCLSIVGVAREVAAITGKTLRYPQVTLVEDGEDIHDLTSVTIMDPDLCPRYSARVIKEVTIGPSPLWMRQRLEAVGLRSINNIVDITNFVMMELGQPLHAFDFRFLEEGRIVVRRSREGETFISLDEKERLLRSDTLMICDGVKPVAIAGIMGGLNSEVKDDTTTVLLESAYFLPASIRRSSRWLGMATDAAFRFERGVDPEGVIRALDRAAALMAELGGGRVCRGIIDAYPNPLPVVKDIPLRVSRVRTFLGSDVGEEEMTDILRRLEMVVEPGSAGEYRVTPPTFRVDITREIDLIEEIARLHGYEKVPVTMPSASGTPEGKTNKEILEDEIRVMMRGCGYSETITYSFIPVSFPERLDIPEDKERCVKISNPLSEEQGVMRTTLLYSLLDVMGRNARAGIHDLKIYELGRVYFQRGRGELPDEQQRLGILASGCRYDNSWHHKGVDVDFYDVKGCIENTLAALNIRDVRFLADKDVPFLHPGRSSRIYSGGRSLGILGEVHPRVRERFDLRRPVIVAELDMDALLALWKPQRMSFTEISKFPPSLRDVAFIVGEQMDAQVLLDAALAQNKEILEKVSIFDIYRGGNLPEGKKSIGIRFIYRSLNKTLTDDEINATHAQVIQAVMEASSAIIRGE